MKKRDVALVNEVRIVTTLNYYYAGEPSVLEEIAGGQVIEDYYCFILNSISKIEFCGYTSVNEHGSAEDLQYVAYFKNSEKRNDTRLIFDLGIFGNRQTKGEILQHIERLKQQAPNDDFQVNSDKTELCFPTVCINNKSFNAYKEACREIVDAVTQ